jgi:hypothetical protein
MIQQRIIDRLTTQWNLLKEGEEIPDFSKLNKAALADIWPHCLVIKTHPKVEDAQASYQYSEIGSMAETLFKENPVGQYFSPNVKVSQIARLVRRISELSATSTPLTDEGQFINDANRVVKFRTCLLPFSTASRLSHIVIGVSWREI